MQIILLRIVLLPTLVCFLALFSFSNAVGQTGQAARVAKISNKTLSPDENPVLSPGLKDYRGITIGMPAVQVREKLEKFLEAKGEKQDFLRISDGESAQVFYDADGKVRAVSVDYLVNKSEPPTPLEVLGVEAQPKADGSIYARESYPDAGYWVSYNRTNGDSPLVTITMQVMW